MVFELSVEMVDLLQRIRDTGRYDADAAVMLAALRLLNDFESLRTEINKGLADLNTGVGIPSDVIFAELRARAAEIAARHAADRQRPFDEALESSIERYGEALRRLADQ